MNKQHNELTSELIPIIITVTICAESVDDDEDSNVIYKHQYVIFDKNRLFPDYVIFLEYDPEGDDKLRVVNSATAEQFFETNEKIINEAYYKARATVDNQVCSLDDRSIVVHISTCRTNKMGMNHS